MRLKHSLPPLALVLIAAAAVLILRNGFGISADSGAKGIASVRGIGEEIARIDLGMDKARGIGVSPEGLLAVVGDRTLKIFRISGSSDSVSPDLVASQGGPVTPLPGAAARFDPLTPLPIAVTALNQEPRCVAVNGNERIFVGMSGHVEVYDPRGRSLETWSDMGQNVLLTSIAADNDSVFAADAAGRMVWEYEASGRLKSFITSATAPFVVPSPYFDVALGPKGSLWICNPGRHSLQQHSREDGRLVSTWGRSSRIGSGFSGCCNPSHFALLSDSSFVTSEKGLLRVRLHDSQGNLKGFVIPPSAIAIYSGGLDVAVDARDRVYLLDAGASAVRVFVLRGEG